MRPIQPSVFGSFLKQYRLAANLAQETLAEQSGVSADAISMLERGTRQSPRPDTIRLLAKALGLSEQQRAALAASAPRHRRPRDASGRATPDANSDLAPDVSLAALLPPARALPRPLIPLIRREHAVAELTALLRRDDTRVLILTGLGGVGKTLLALHAAHAARRFPCWCGLRAPRRRPSHRPSRRDDRPPARHPRR